MMPEISVVIPTFNRRAMLREAIASVAAQRGANYEIIVIDDGSTDGTWEDLPSAPGRLRAIRTARRGPAAARNRGIEAARGELVAFLDSDDLWHPQKLVRQSAFMREHPRCPISQCGEIWLRGERRVNPGTRHRKRSGDIFIDSLHTCLISPSAAILRRGLLAETGGFDEDMAACEDYDLWLRILARHQAGLLDEALVTRRAGHRGQLSAAIPALDRFRVFSLAKLLSEDFIRGDRRLAVAAEMNAKSRILAKGHERRGRGEEAAFYRETAQMALERWSLGPDAALERARSRIRSHIVRYLHRAPAPGEDTGGQGAPAICGRSFLAWRDS
jgi:glycosyltransferase involved in cell wall biosynthesis